MRMELEAVLLGGLVPAAVSALALLLSLRFGGRLSEAVRRVGAAAALGLGFLAGWVALRLSWSESPLRPIHPWEWLPYLALLAVLTGLHDLTYALQRSRLARMRAAAAQFLRAWRSDRPGVLAWAVRVVVAGASAWMLVPADEAGRLWWVAGLGVFILLHWFGLDPLTRLWPGPLLPALLAVVAGMVAALIFLAHFAKLALITGVLVAVLAAAAVVAWRVRGIALLRGMAPGLAVLFLGLLASGRFTTSMYSSVPLTSYLLLAVAPLAVAIAAPRRRPESVGVMVGRIALALTPGVVALVLAWAQSGEY